MLACLDLPCYLYLCFPWLRRGEAFGLRWIDVDFEKNTIHIKQNYTTTKGKPYLGKRKTRHSKKGYTNALNSKKRFAVAPGEANA